MEIENKSIACAGESFEGQTDHGNKGKTTQEQRGPVPESPATQAPQYSPGIKKSITLSEKGELHQRRLCSYAGTTSTPAFPEGTKGRS